MSNNLRDEVLSRTDIVDIIGEVVRLRKRGENFIGLCPFHNEKTPSFTVSPDKQIYKCFGCGKAGNVLTFAQEVNGFSFKEALYFLADKAGISYNENTYEHNREYDKKDIAYKALDYSASFYNSLLNDTEGEVAKRYLYSRSYTDETIEKFQLGYSSQEWNKLSEYLLSLNISKEALEDAGLISTKENSNRFWDRFRGRLMFPIKNQIGKVIGFGARDLSGAKDTAKYLNSPQSIVYDKSTAIYGIFNAKNNIRSLGYAILCEGYADVISLHQAGFNNAVASCGTALTKGQLINIKRYTNKIYISYDSDDAGLNATAKAVELALPAGFDIKIIKLPQGEDPDSLITKSGASAYQNYLTNAIDFVEFLYAINNENDKLSSPYDKSTFIKDTIKLIYSIPDNLQHDFYISRLANLMHLSESQIKGIYQKKSDIVEEIRKEDSLSKINIYDLETGSDSYKENLDLLNVESLLLKQLIDDVETYNYCKKNLSISSKSFFTDSAMSVFDTLELIYEQFSDFAQLFDSECEELDKDAVAFLMDLNFEKDSASDKWTNFGAEELVIDKQRIINDCLLNIELHKIDKQIELFKSEETAISKLEKLKKISELQQEKIKFKQALENNDISIYLEKNKNR